MLQAGQEEAGMVRNFFWIGFICTREVETGPGQNLFQDMLHAGKEDTSMVRTYFGHASCWIGRGRNG
jgi:hypothetical protein